MRVQEAHGCEKFTPQSMEALNFYFHAFSNFTRFFYALEFVDASDEPF
jgi:hypothetical protein|tara:strand:- start:885 stop:1028 length:144 start_codon:yes stop_codon:yes gene_type:complete